MEFHKGIIGKLPLFSFNSFVKLSLYNMIHFKHGIYSETCVKQPLSKRPKIGFQDQLSLNAGQSIAECSKRSMLQYF